MPDPYLRPTPAHEVLENVTAARVFFAHQSVGMNILDGVRAVYQSQHLPTPHFVDVAAAGSDDNLLHTRIGTNGDPFGKIREFDTVVRTGLSAQVDVAILKLCYADVRVGTDVQGVLIAYIDTLAALQRDYPATAFVAVTVPLTVKRSPRGAVKGWLGRGDRLGPEHNTAREEFNARLRTS